MGKKTFAALSLLFAALAIFAGKAGSSPSQTAPSRPVGFRVIERVDASRASKRFPNGRPLQIVLWYPAASGGPQIAYRDYISLAAREISFGASEAAELQAIDQYKTSLSSAGVKPEEADYLLSTKMTASRGAPPAPGRFPLVLIAQGNDHSAHDQAFLAEFLAARGYTVATVPSQARIGGAMKSEEEIPAQVEDQAADLALALRTVRFEEEVRPGRFGVVGTSFGARCALLLAARDPEVAALVSFDGGIGRKEGKGWIEKVRGFQRARATAPLLHFYQKRDPRLTPPDFDLLRSLDRSDRWLVEVDGLFHSHFSSLGVLVRTVPTLAKATSADERTPAAWEAVASATASFLDYFVANSAPKRSPRWMPPESPLLHPTSLPLAPAVPAKKR